MSLLPACSAPAPSICSQPPWPSIPCQVSAHPARSRARRRNELRPEHPGRRRWRARAVRDPSGPGHPGRGRERPSSVRPERRQRRRRQTPSGPCHTSRGGHRATTPATSPADRAHPPRDLMPKHGRGWPRRTSSQPPAPSCPSRTRPPQASHRAPPSGLCWWCVQHRTRPSEALGTLWVNWRPDNQARLHASCPQRGPKRRAPRRLPSQPRAAATPSRPRAAAIPLRSPAHRPRGPAGDARP